MTTRTDADALEIERAENMDREYIPLPGGWEVQTKGSGSTLRLLDKKTGERHGLPLGETFMVDFVERMAREVNAASRVLATEKRTSAPTETEAPFYPPCSKCGKKEPGACKDVRYLRDCPRVARAAADASPCESAPVHAPGVAAPTDAEREELAKWCDDATEGAIFTDAKVEVLQRIAALLRIPATPPGWKLVPEVPTQEMIKRGSSFMSGLAYYEMKLAERIYCAMLATAPQPKKEGA